MLGLDGRVGEGKRRKGRRAGFYMYICIGRWIGGWRERGREGVCALVWVWDDVKNDKQRERERERERKR